MGKLSRFDTVYLGGADKPSCDMAQIAEQIARLEDAKTELSEIERQIQEIEVRVGGFFYTFRLQTMCLGGYCLGGLYLTRTLPRA